MNLRWKDWRAFNSYKDAKEAAWVRRDYKKSEASFFVRDLDEPCLVCEIPATSLVKGRPYCHAHGYRKYFGHAYVPPTTEEVRQQRIMWKSMKRYYESFPPTKIKTEHGLEMEAMFWDKEALKRYCRIYKEVESEEM